MLKTKIGHVTVVDSEESTTIIGITHGLAWEKKDSYMCLQLPNYIAVLSIMLTLLPPLCSVINCAESPKDDESSMHMFSYMLNV